MSLPAVYLEQKLSILNPQPSTPFFSLFFSINIKNPDSGARMPGLKSLLRHLLAVDAWQIT